MAFELHTRVLKNPYSDSIPDAALSSLVQAAAEARALDIERGYLAGEYPRSGMSFVVLDPTAPVWQPSDDAVFAVVVIGATGSEFLPNAAAKVIEHRDHGVDCGVLVYAQNHRLADGDFRFGFSVCLEGTYVGGSGQSEIQDRYQATVLAADLNYRIAAARASWVAENPDVYWYGTGTEPGSRYANIWSPLKS